MSAIASSVPSSFLGFNFPLSLRPSSTPPISLSVLSRSLSVLVEFTIMEEYLEYMKTLRSQMNDVEDQAAKISVEKQMLSSTIQTTENDLLSAKSEIRQLNDRIVEMEKAKGNVCSEILERRKKIASLDLDSSNLFQTLELIKQEKVSLSAKLLQNSSCYSKSVEDINANLQEQQGWLISKKLHRDAEEHYTVEDKLDGQTTETGGTASSDSRRILDQMDSKLKNSMIKLEVAKAELHQVAEMKLKTVNDNNMIKESAQLMNYQINNFNPELRAMDMKTLEEKHQALLSDKSGETKYLRSLQHQMGKLKETSHLIKCACGEEYMVRTGLHA